ncbi:MAG: amidohydrolase family protein [Streptosporangiales bacterium]|nr:amidohydrolase family protein [Streptosporangiales bacterium]
MTAELVLHGGTIHTFTEGVVPAMLVRDGRVAAVGSADDCRRAAAGTPRSYDLAGRTVLPGFVDAHVHPLLLGDALGSVDLSPARSIAELVQLLRRHAATVPEPAAVTGYGYDQSKLAERRHPSRADLDAVSTDRTVRVQHVSGHGYVVNSTALRESGITADTVTPPGGRIDRDAAGEPTGVVFDAACDLLTGPSGVKIEGHGPNFHLPLDVPGRAATLALGQRQLLSVGVTTVCDAQVTARERLAYQEAEQDGSLRLRTHQLTLSSGLDELEARVNPSPVPLGVKLYADGSVTARTAYLGQHCDGCARPDGYLYHEPDELIALIGRAHRLGLPTATHAQGELPIDIVLDAVERCRRADPRTDLVHRIEHCGFPTTAQIARMAELRVVPVPQPMQVTLFADSLIDEYGDYGGRFYPTGDFHRAGLPVVLSSDGPVTMPDPLRAVHSAVTRQTVGDLVAGGTAGSVANQGVATATAFAGVTTTAARLLGCHDVGALAPGSLADFVVLDTDPTQAVERLRTAAVLETWIGGERVFAA